MSVNSKTKSYWIQKRYLLVFIFLHLPFDLRSLLLKVRLLTSWSPVQYNFLFLASNLIAFVLRSILCFQYCCHLPPSMSSLRRNLFHLWIMYPHPIIYQNPSTKLPRLSRVTSRPFILAFAIGWSWCWRSKNQACHIYLAVLSPLTHGSSWWLFDKVWIYFSCSTTTDLESCWSASNLLS